MVCKSLTVKNEKFQKFEINKSTRLINKAICHQVVIILTKKIQKLLGF